MLRCQAAAEVTETDQQEAAVFQGAHPARVTRRGAGQGLPRENVNPEVPGFQIVQE